LREYFSENRERVFFSRQIEVFNEDHYFHWITNRAVRDLVEQGEIVVETRPTSVGGTLNLLWHRSFRYYKRPAARVLSLVEEYANSNIGIALGLQGELMVLEGLAMKQFVLTGRETREHHGNVWRATDHNLDFIVERDGIGYGVEVKNTLPYIELEELRVKVQMCAFLGLRPLFVVRMMPVTWMHEVQMAGGFVLTMKWQLYPWGA